MTTQAVFDTFAQVTGGIVGTAPAIFVATTDQAEAVIITAGAISTLYATGIIKVGDIVYANYDVDGSQGSNVYVVTATSGGSLITYPNAVGGALLAANNLNDVISASSSRSNLVLGANDAVHFGDISSGSSGNAGQIVSFPSTALRGFLSWQASANAGNTFVAVTNSSHGQNSTYSIPDCGNAIGSLLNCSGHADTGANLICFDVTVTSAQLASAALKALYVNTGAAQYKIRNLWLNKGGTNFSGGGGDRLLAITDGTTVYSVVPATNLQTLVNAKWGDSTPLPFPASAAINTSTAGGANLSAQYSGGSADYSAGSVVISGMLQRVA